MTARIDGEWCRCGKCGHKLMKILTMSGGVTMIEVKCHSCKEINVLWYDSSDEEDKYDERNA